MNKHNQEHMFKLLKQAPFPVTHKDLVEYARLKGDGDDIVDAVKAIPHKTYTTYEELEEELEKSN